MNREQNFTNAEQNQRADRNRLLRLGGFMVGVTLVALSEIAQGHYVEADVVLAAGLVVAGIAGAMMSRKSDNQAN